MNIATRAFRHVRTTSSELIKTSKLYRVTAIVSLALVVVMIALPLWKIRPAAGEDAFIPLHYNIYFGIDRFGPWYQVFVLPAIGFTLLVINSIFQAVFYHHERILSYFFAATTILAELALAASMIFIVLLNL